MKALRIYKGAKAKVDEIAVPKIEAGQVLIKVAACGVCGSDVPRIMDHKAHYYPIVLGHEFSGVVEEVGAAVQSLQKGDHVVVAPLLPCFACEACKNGNYSLCKQYSFIGSRVQGAMAEYIAVPERNVVKLDDTIDLVDAAMTEPMTVALHGFKQNHHEGGKMVAILGMGTIGAFCAQLAKAKKASNVSVIVRNQKYDELAKLCRVDNIINTSNVDWKDQVEAVTSGRGFDFVYETAGSTETMLQAFEIAANKAHVCFIGTPKHEITFSVQQWELMNRKEFYLTGSWMSYSGVFPGDEWIEACKYLQTKEIQIFPEMFAEKIALDEGARLVEVLKKGSVKGRIVITM